MSSDVATAYRRLQLQLLSSSSYSHTERCERSLDELLRHFDRQGNPAKIANAAFGNAGKVVRSRLKRHTDLSLIADIVPDSDVQAGYERVIMDDFCSGVWNSTSPRERLICTMLMDGYDAGEIASELNLKVTHVHVLISRIRRGNIVASLKS